MKMNLKTKIVIMLIILITIPMLILGQRSTSLAEERMLEQYLSSMKEINNATTTSLENVLLGNERALKVLSTNYSLRNFLDTPELIPLMKDALTVYREVNPDVLNSYVGTKDKQMFIVPETELPADYDPTSRIWYIDAIKTNEVAWTVPYIDVGTGETVITAAVQIPKSNTGNSPGIVGIDLLLSYFSELVSEVKVGETGEAYIIDKDGMIFAHPNPEMIGKNIVDIGFTDETLKLYFETGSGTLDYTDEATKDERFISYQKFSNVDWVLVNSLSYKEVTSTTDKIKYSIISIGLI